MDSETMNLFRKVLIANRGEIACRIMRTCRRLGIRTVAVYSDADARSLHVRTADEAVHIGGSPASESYLSITKILAAAERTAAEAIHPGYGFLAENPEFAEACAAAAITFIGPPASAIRAMGSKSAAKALLQNAGVPLTPGYHGDNQDPAFLLGQANAIGYPVLIKASAGGGGKGMRRVERASEFPAALASCKREATASFGDDRVLIERYILEPRHIEIQVFADTQGNVVSLFERDCSVQRRYQKIVEEAPAPGLSAAQRLAMSKAACDAARAVGYVGAGTVEFIADPQGNFYFMEMNTRLQVEHPVTEKITGLDLVEWQLRVAAGEPLPAKQDQLSIRGHALEARIYAEDPANGFLPSPGPLLHLAAPAESPHVRIDTGVEQGDRITSFYDPLIAKLIVWDESRSAAIQQLGRALGAFQIVGVATNLDFLKRLIATSSFENARLSTGLIEHESESLFPAPSAPPHSATLLAALAVLLDERRAAQQSESPWAIADGWRLNGFLQRTIHFRDNDPVEVEYRKDGFQICLGAHSHHASGTLGPGGALAASVDGLRQHATAIANGTTLHLFFDDNHWIYRFIDPLSARDNAATVESSLLAPMPGRVTALLAAPGSHVEAGTPLLVLEAMKMEYTIKAPSAGNIELFLFSAGDQVSEGVHLLRFVPD
jgi:3-methylcrotonyl-CoA carboxylase alpha subunit